MSSSDRLKAGFKPKECRIKFDKSDINQDYLGLESLIDWLIVGMPI